MTALRLTIGVPVHNEEAVMPELLARTRAVLDAVPGGPHELIFVDDGSFDRTLALLEAAASEDPRIVVVSLSRNFGHQAALSAALDEAQGDAVVLMDGDLQDSPESIPAMFEKFREGFDVVYAQRVKRKEPWWLRAAYYGFYRVAASLSELHLPLDAGDFGLMSRRVVDEVRRMPEHHRYLRGLRSWVGFRQIAIPIERAARAAGEPKYDAWRLLKLASDGIFAFSVVPLRAAALLGLLAIGASVAYALYAVWAKFFLDRSPQGFTALTILITFLGGFILLFLGVIGEYVGRIYDESKGRPIYIRARVIRGKSAGEAASPSPSSVGQAR
jgi:dolichol-phosphate mannosyltransferase